MNIKGNMPNTTKAVEGMKTNTTINNIQNMLNKIFDAAKKID